MVKICCFVLCKKTLNIAGSLRFHKLRWNFHYFLIFLCGVKLIREFRTEQYCCTSVRCKWDSTHLAVNGEHDIKHIQYKRWSLFTWFIKCNRKMVSLFCCHRKCNPQETQWDGDVIISSFSCRMHDCMVMVCTACITWMASCATLGHMWDSVTLSDASVRDTCSICHVSVPIYMKFLSL